MLRKHAFGADYRMAYLAKVFDLFILVLKTKDLPCSCISDRPTRSIMDIFILLLKLLLLLLLLLSADTYGVGIVIIVVIRGAIAVISPSKERLEVECGY